MRPPLEVADIFRQHGTSFRLTYPLSPEQRRVMRAIEACRTSALGGHVEQCDACNYSRVSYNSCRNRHCPKCQSLAKARWLDARMADLLPVEYFHVVFTLPEQLAALALQNKRIVYNILFASAAETLRTIAADPKHLGAEIGFLAALARAYERDKLTFHGTIAYLADPLAFKRLLDSLRASRVVGLCQAPLRRTRASPGLSRPLHSPRGYSNHRLLAVKDGNVTFSWKDYARGNQQRAMTLKTDEFIRRFLLHVLPRGFQRLRQFGFLANRHRRDKLALCRQLLNGTAGPTVTNQPLSRDYQSLYETVTGQSLQQGPACRTGTMKLTERLAPLSGVLNYTPHSRPSLVAAAQAIDSS